MLDDLEGPGSPFEVTTASIRGVEMKVWKNIPETLWDLFEQSRRYGEREFIVLDDERVSYASIGSAVDILSAELRRRGVSKGDRVAIGLPNSPEWVVVFFATISLGAIATLFSPGATLLELRHILSNSGCKAAFFGPLLIKADPDGSAWPSTLQAVFSSRSKFPCAASVTALEEVIGPSESWLPLQKMTTQHPAASADDDATIIYTSGTTGLPKGVLASHRAQLCSIPQGGYAQARRRAFAGEHWYFDADANDPVVDLILTPFYHVSGVSSSLLPMMSIGGKIVLMRAWFAQRALELIERERVNILGGVPTVAAQFIDHPLRTKYDLSSLTQVLFGGAPCPPRVVDALAAEGFFPGNGWGMTETSGTFLSHLGQEYTDRQNSCGLPGPTGELQIRNVESGEVIQNGSYGRLWVRGPGVMTAYWDEPELTTAVLQDGWLDTGDIARLSADGYWQIVDRAKDLIIRAGENIYCTEVEHVIAAHPSVEDVGVFGLDHPEFGEEVAAIIRKRPSASLEASDIRQFATALLPMFKIPTAIMFTDDDLPRNPTGKLLRRALPDLAKLLRPAQKGAH